MQQNIISIQNGIRSLEDFELDFVGDAEWNLATAVAVTAGGAVTGATAFGVLAVFGGPVGWGACGVATLAGGVSSFAGYSVYEFVMWMNVMGFGFGGC